MGAGWQKGLVIIDPRYWLPGNYSQDSFKAAIKSVSDLVCPRESETHHAWCLLSWLQSCSCRKPASCGSLQVHKQYLEEEAEKGGRLDPSMPGFATMFWRRLMATPGTCQSGECWLSWLW